MNLSISPITRALIALFIALASIGIGAQSAIGGGGGEGGNADLLGKTKKSPSPNCPETQQYGCEVTGQVTGYQKRADGKKGLFKVRDDGHIVAWSVDLGDPAKAERKTFGEASQTDEFGKAPTAGISIIRRQEDKVFKLRGSSPLLNVRAFYGEKPTFTLEEPLPVKEGDVVALTTATWLPAFTTKEGTASDEWVAGRPERNCEIPAEVPDEDRLEYFFEHTSPHRKPNSERPYECKYDGARLLYWAYFVKD